MGTGTDMAETIRYITSLPLDELRLLKPIPVVETVEGLGEEFEYRRWYCRPAKFWFTSSHPGGSFETTVSRVIAATVSRNFLLSFARCKGVGDRRYEIFADLSKYVAPVGQMSRPMAEELAGNLRFQPIVGPFYTLDFSDRTIVQRCRKLGDKREVSDWARDLYASRSGSRIERFGGGKAVERSNRTGFYFFPRPEDRPDA